MVDSLPIIVATQVGALWAALAEQLRVNPFRLEGQALQQHFQVRVLEKVAHLLAAAMVVLEPTAHLKMAQSLGAAARVDTPRLIATVDIQPVMVVTAESLSSTN